MGADLILALYVEHVPLGRTHAYHLAQRYVAISGVRDSTPRCMFPVTSTGITVVPKNTAIVYMVALFMLAHLLFWNYSK